MIIRYGESINNDDISLGEEIRRENWVDESIWYEKNINQIENGIWIQKNGEQINIMNMTSSHIQNCINMLNKRLEKNISNEFDELWIKRFEKELIFRNYIKNILSGVLD